jgi:nicotinate-nucleotide adenylyltransferase
VIVPPPFGDGQRIGLFGGSFNPPHGGHRAVALYALKRLDLDWIWWLVSPQNPLKDADGYRDYDERLKVTRQVARHPRFIVTDLEQQLDTRATAATLAALEPFMRRGRFVWIMGADSFANLHHWNDWTDIPETIPLAILARPGFSMRALESPAALRYDGRRIASAKSRQLPGSPPPAWCFIPMPLRAESSTAIRRRARKGGSPGRRSSLRRHELGA